MSNLLVTDVDQLDPRWLTMRCWRILLCWFGFHVYQPDPGFKMYATCTRCGAKGLLWRNLPPRG